MVLKDRKTGDVYELNIVNVVVECDIIYVSILYPFVYINMQRRAAVQQPPTHLWAGFAGGGPSDLLAPDECDEYTRPPTDRLSHVWWLLRSWLLLWLRLHLGLRLSLYLWRYVSA